MSFHDRTDTDMRLARQVATRKLRDLDRELRTIVTEDSIRAEAEAVRERATEALAKCAAEGMRASRVSSPGAGSWEAVERLVTNTVLADPGFPDRVVSALGTRMPTEAALAPKRAERDRLAAEMDAIDDEVERRRDERQAEYLEGAFRSRSGSPAPEPASPSTGFTGLST